MAANGHRRLTTSSHTEPRNTGPGTIARHVWHHPATLRPRLTVKQVHRELVLDFADPGGIGSTTTGSSCPDHRDPGAPELATREQRTRVAQVG